MAFTAFGTGLMTKHGIPLEELLVELFTLVSYIPLA